MLVGSVQTIKALYSHAILLISIAFGKDGQRFDNPQILDRARNELSDNALSNGVSYAFFEGGHSPGPELSTALLSVGE